MNPIHCSPRRPAPESAGADPLEVCRAMKLDRMMAREVTVPAALGFVTYTFLLMMRGLFALIEQIFVRGLPVRDALAVLVVTLPHVVVLTIPDGIPVRRAARGRAVERATTRSSPCRHPGSRLGGWFDRSWPLALLLDPGQRLPVPRDRFPSRNRALKDLRVASLSVGPKPGQDPARGVLRGVSQPAAVRAAGG